MSSQYLAVDSAESMWRGVGHLIYIYTLCVDMVLGAGIFRWNCGGGCLWRVSSLDDEVELWEWFSTASTTHRLSTLHTNYGSILSGWL